jgi:hypothetical protein
MVQQLGMLLVTEQYGFLSVCVSLALPLVAGITPDNLVRVICFAVLFVFYLAYPRRIDAHGFSYSARARMARKMTRNFLNPLFKPILVRLIT